MRNDPNLAECIEQLKQEIQVLSQHRHPNILQYYVEDWRYIYLEYAHHDSIDKYIQERLGTLTESVVSTLPAILWLDWLPCMLTTPYMGI